MINLELKKSGYNCYDQVMESIINFFHAPEHYPLIYTNRWGFSFNSQNNNLIGDKISDCFTDTDLMEDITNLKKNETYFKDINLFVKILKTELKNNRPVVGFIDNFTSPWNNYYKKIHGAHAIIFTDIDDEKGYVYINDIYYSSNIQKSSYLDLSTMLISFYTFEIIKTVHKFNKKMCIEVIISHLKNMFSSNMFENINNFADCFKKNFDIKKEILDFHTLQEIPLIMAINNISYSRKCFNRALEYIKIKYRTYTLDYFIDQLNDIANNWSNIGMLLSKYAVKKDINTQNINNLSSTIKSISFNERKIASDFVAFLKNDIEV